MNITTLKKVLPTLLDSKITPWIWGFHGKGKSETIESWCKDSGYLVFNFRLNTQADVGDFLGLQDFTTDAKGKKISTSFFKPDWLQKCFEFCEANPDKKAVIFLDEINRAARMDLIGPVFQMALDHRLHTYEFPSNLHIICASNPDTANYSVLSLDDKALFSRFCHIYFNPSKEEWRDYAVKKGYDESIIDFIAEHPDFLEEKDLEKFSIQDYAKPDRRKYSLINKLLVNKLSKSDRHELFSGLIGIEAATSYIKFLDRTDKPLTIEDILDNYDTNRSKIKKYAKENRTDIFHNVNVKIEDYFKPADCKLDAKQAENVLDYLLDLPLDIMFKVAHGIYKNRTFMREIEKLTEKRAKFIKRLQQAKADDSGDTANGNNK